MVTHAVAQRPSRFHPFHDSSRSHRLIKVGAWLIVILVVVTILQLAGVDVIGWPKSMWDEITAVPAGYLAAGLLFQAGATAFAAISYYGILSVAYPGEVTFLPILAAYAAGVALNGFLPANIGTFATLLMFVAIIPSCTVAGAIAAQLVQKLFFTIAGTFVYLYLFLAVPGSFDENLGTLTDHPVLVASIAAGGVVLLVILGRIFWAQVKKLWGKAKRGGVILSQPRRYFARVFLPSFLSWTCKLVVVGLFLAAFAVPVTFEAIMWVVGSGSLTNLVSVTPGSVGITQATNTLALDVCCQVPHSQAVDYSTAQQLITTAWNVLFAVLLVVWAFGWTGGKQLVTDSYEDAKVKVAEQKERRAAKREAAREQLEASGEGRLVRLRHRFTAGHDEGTS